MSSLKTIIERATVMFSQMFGFSVIVLVTCLCGVSVQEKQIVGYYRSWRMYTTCEVEELNPNLSTILIYAFAGISNDNTIEILDYNGDIKKGGYIKFNALKKQNPKLKTLLSIAGGKSGSRRYSLLAESDTVRMQFIDSALEFMQKYGFDGIDIDWEFPTLLGGRPQDRKNFPKLLEEIRAKFDEHNYLLTVAVGVSGSLIEKAYNVSAITKAVHFINLMMYNLGDYRSGKTEANSPLYSDGSLNVESCTRAWLSRGATPGKLLLGIPAYGKSYTLNDTARNGIGSPASGPGLPGPWSKDGGNLWYDEILQYEKAGWTKRWSDKQQVPYLFRNTQWVGYDDTQSVRQKVKFAHQNSLGGVMMWSVDMDDARGRFGAPFPLLRSINKYL